MAKNKKIYISGKITGNPNYWADFERAEERLRCEGAEVVNPAREVWDAGFADYPYEQIMEYCFGLLGGCDSIYMLQNYKDSSGAMMELHRAEILGLEVLYEKEEIAG